MGNYFTVTDQKVTAAEIAMRIYATLNIILEIIMSYFASNKDGKLVEIKDIDTICKNLRDTYEGLEDQVEYYKKKLEEYNKDSEIQKYKAEIQELRSRSLLLMSDKEAKAARDFRNRHYEKCALPLNSKSAGNTYIYELTGTGLGTCIKITCPICGQSEDITDIDSW